MKSKLKLQAFPLLLPLLLLVPYALFLPDFRLLVWAAQTLYKPFWLLLAANLLGAASASWLFGRLLKQGRWVFDACALATFFHVSWLAMSQKRHGMLVLIFVLAAGLLVAREWARRTLAMPCFSSRRRWWESHPKTIPGLKAAVLGAKDEMPGHEVVVTNLGREGCFIFFPEGRMERKPAWIRLSLDGGDSYTAPVSTVFVTRDKYGAGLQFHPEGFIGDESKDLGDMIFKMRSLGYVDQH
ncbi:MAG: hypothetical protein HUU37_00970 [Bdellovibrionales bacterium]|nr:hypothetical protein [Bdellovibrionales bacterium]